MRSRIAAARQLGTGGLSRRLGWRLSQLVRVAHSASGLDHDRKLFSRTAAVTLAEPPVRSYLPDFGEVSAAAADGGLISDAERQSIAEAAADVLNDRVSLRAVGNIELRYTPGHWYDYDRETALMVNRHDFLVTLARAYVVGGDPAVAEKTNRFFCYWIDACGADNLRRHDTPIDAAIRLINWAWIFNTSMLSIDEARYKKLAEIIYEQLEYISVWRSAGGNHLVLEALALYVYGRMFPQCRSGRKWGDWGKACLLTQLLRQTTADGVHTEQSMFYHQAVATHYLKFILAARNFVDPIPDEHTGRFRKMLSFVHSTVKPNLTHPVVGDGEPLVTQDREHWESRALLAARSVLFGDPVYERFLPMIGESALWLLGRSEASVSSTDAPPASQVFDDSGIACFRTADAYVFFDAAPFSDPEFPHHGHADALSFELCVGNAELFIDPGGYGYYDDEFRRFFRSTAAHNTVEVDGKSQSQLFGVLGYGRLARSKILDVTISETFDRVCALHDGYYPVRHRRELVMLKDPLKILLIVDRLTGDGRHRGVSRFHASAGGKFDLERRCISTAAAGSTHEFYFALNATAAIHEGTVAGRRGNRPQGWVSPETGKVDAAETLELEFEFGREALIVFAVCLEAGTSIGARIVGGGGVDLTAGDEEIFLPVGQKGLLALDEAKIMAARR
jgi:hypothetical protein